MMKKLQIRDEDVERLTERLRQLDQRHGEVLERAHKDMAMMTEEKKRTLALFRPDPLP